jgi:hypothetical protein
MTKSIDIVRRKRYFQNPCGYMDQAVSTSSLVAKYIHEKQNSPCFVDFGDTNVDRNVDRNVVDDGAIPSISSLVDDISQFQVDETIKW